jgi:hypothetical protein
MRLLPYVDTSSTHNGYPELLRGGFPLCSEKVVDLLFGLRSSITVLFLQEAKELIALAFYPVKIVVGELAPLHFGLTAQLFPHSFKDTVCCHLVSSPFQFTVRFREVTALRRLGARAAMAEITEPTMNQMMGKERQSMRIANLVFTLPGTCSRGKPRLPLGRLTSFSIVA